MLIEGINTTVVSRPWVVIETSPYGNVAAWVMLDKDKALAFCRQLLEDNFDVEDAKSGLLDIEKYGIFEEGDWSVVLTQGEELD